MKVLVFGATGKVGRLTVDAALAAGHAVTAFARSPDRLAPRPGLTPFTGDVTKASDVADAMTGQDVVILTFGAPVNRRTILQDTDICESGTRNAVAAMQEAGTPRLIATTSIGVGDSAGRSER
ncbi:3 beta-hydroxysteroid dehydrogenase/Delta 5--_4-isomerase [Roseivivax jejudonensis]|uniref:3 beta-hydroxysteroid dehydrogenase/Delta 5-->4-isomerase n=1 Tax=Roseivivax jejudonensis TaxID=1529041 RepID=A0A1X7A8A0_9RHOB|nr:NAD(P)-binding oxidoreductase [Roseivivax jejudonensis]SLN71386.1 3 beta-hydroxysteroid dehydrogenase/Delta 5-->4-isomerase [Roseivivax jejudonensis]